jgi:hypothetical protein
MRCVACRPRASTRNSPSIPTLRAGALAGWLAPLARREVRAVERYSLLLVRFLLFLALATIAVALAFYIFKRDRRYLRFIWQVVKYTIFLLLGVLVFYAFERLVAVASVVN